MTDFISIHPENPQSRAIKQASDIIANNGIIAYPTDSAYALGCNIGDKKSLDRIRQIRNLDKNHNFTLICNNLSDLSLYAKVNNNAFRLLKKHIPGPYTFIFEATKEVPKRLQHSKRKTIGLRVPDNKICHHLLNQLGKPIMSVSLIVPNNDLPLIDGWSIYEELNGKVDAVIDGGTCQVSPSSVIDFSGDFVNIIRHGQGNTEAFE